QQRLAQVFAQVPPPGFVADLAATISDWSDETALQQARAIVFSRDAVPEVRFRVGKALHQRGQHDLLPAIWDAVACPGPVGWFASEDWNWLPVGEGMRHLSLRLVLSPHPHAYRPVVDSLACQDGPDDEIQHALTAFLEVGTERLRESRL